jgi:flavin reductase (DIM6/NTAB) family NADH-FMN oxidoreductase RutF
MPNLKKALRAGMRRLASGVCVISTQAEGEKYAMTASSVTSLSDEPASLLVCVNQQASMQSILTFGQPFVVNLLSSDQEAISNLCAGQEGQKRFSLGNWQETDKGLPYLEDAQASFICRVDNDGDYYGTHQIVIGRLENVLLSEVPIAPLIYLDGRYRRLAD